MYTMYLGTLLLPNVQLIVCCDPRGRPTAEQRPHPSRKAEMDRARQALALARAGSSAHEGGLADLRAELAELELQGSAITPPPTSVEAHLLGTSIDELAALHEGHAQNMRDYGRAVGGSVDYGMHYAFGSANSAVPPPMPSMEPQVGAPRADGRPAAVSRSSLGAPTSRPAFDRPLGGSLEVRPTDAMPMQRQSHERRELAAAASAREQAAIDSRYAQQAAAARARVEAIQGRAADRSAYLAERDQRASHERAARIDSLGGGGGGFASSSGAATARTSRDAPLRASADGGLVAPVTALRMPATARPRSAPHQRRRHTVPVPFSFAFRPKRETAAMRSLRADLEREEAEFEEARQGKAKVRELPDTTAPGLYSQMVEEAEAASKDRRQQRRTVPVPFSFAQRKSRTELRADGGEGHAAAPPAGGAGLSPRWVEKGEEVVGDRKSFRARDVPRSMSEPRWEMMQMREVRSPPDGHEPTTDTNPQRTRAQGRGIRGMGIRGMGIRGRGVRGMGIRGMGVQGA